MDNDLLEFQKYLDAECSKELDRVSKKVEIKLKQKIVKNNRVYNPKIYRRTGDILSKIKIHGNDKEKIIYWNGLNYESNNGNIDSHEIPRLLNDGFKHEGWSGIEDKYHFRKPEKFLDEAILEVNREENDEVCKRIDW